MRISIPQKPKPSRLMRTLKSPLFYGLLAFLLVRVGLGFALDLSPTCADGWRSSSIGRSGACSWHGGVDTSAQAVAFIGSAIIGVFVWGFIQNKVDAAEAKVEAEEKAAAEARLKSYRTMKASR